jgi:GNAT superfamily N-acetyltransferase
VPQLLPLVAEYWSFESIAGFEAERVAAQLARLLAQPQLGAAWIAAGESASLGYLLVAWVFSLGHGGITAEIDELYVVPTARAGGIGGALLEAAETESIRQGHASIALQLARHNDAARAFYRARGYRERSGYELMDKRLGASAQNL